MPKVNKAIIRFNRCLCFIDVIVDEAVREKKIPFLRSLQSTDKRINKWASQSVQWNIKQETRTMRRVVIVDRVSREGGRTTFKSGS